ncbi:MAG: hypothetical protein KatS3mg035_0847 [Bacteroidia bacterium]|nr:MAG: hypothetical protein KatS3mg035_0847 [Bacteroidia bacterium]
MNWKYILGVALGLGLLYFAFKDMNFQLLRENLSNGNYWWLLLSLFVSLLSHYVRAWRWTMLIEAAGKSIKIFDAFAAVLVGYMANAGAPRMGEVARCTVLTTKTQTPFATLAGTVFTERAIDVLTLASLILLGLFLEYQKLVHYFIQFLPKFSTYSLLFFVITTVIGFIIVWKTQNYWKKIPILQKVWDFLGNILVSALSIKHLKSPFLFLLSTGLIWFFYVLSTYLGTLILPNTHSIGFSLAFILTIMGGIGMTIPAPGGLGPFHNAIIWTMVAFGYAKSDGEALALIIHTPQLILLVLTGAISYFYLLSPV